MTRLFCLLMIIVKVLSRSEAEGLVGFRAVRSWFFLLHNSTGTILIIPAETHDFGVVVGFDFRPDDQIKANNAWFEK